MGLTGPVQPNDIVMRASEIGTTIPGVASLAMKTARKGAQRGVQGIYQLPSGQEPTPEYMNVAQQSLNNQTQQMTDMLNSMAPEDERLAYINEEEAGILKLLGGSGEMTPQGIPTYKGKDDRDRKGSSSSGSGLGGSGGGGNFNNAETTPGDEMSAMDQMAESANLDRVREKAEAAGGMKKNFNLKPGDVLSEYQGLPDGFRDTYSDTTTGLDALDRFNPDMERKRQVEARIKQYTLANMDPQARSRLSTLNRASIADSGNMLGAISDTDSGMTRDMINDRRDDLLSGEKLSVAELNELGQINQFMGDKSTEGMSIGQELKHKFTNDEFKSDLGNLFDNPVIGLALKGPSGLIGPALKYGYKQYKNYNRPKMTFVDGKAVFRDSKTGKLVDDVEKTVNTGFDLAKGFKAANNLVDIAGASNAPLAARALFGGINALNLNKSILDLSKGKYGVDKPLKGLFDGTLGERFNKKEKEEDENARTTSPIGYLSGTGSFNSYGVGSNNNTDNYFNGQGRDGSGPDPFIYTGGEETEEDETEEDEQIARDRFDRAFANRYYTGPTTLEEIRKYATEGGYNQLSPYGIA